MYKLTSFIMVGLFALCIALPIQADPRDDAAFMESLGGIWRFGGEEGTAWFEFDGKGGWESYYASGASENSGTMTVSREHEVVVTLLKDGATYMELVLSAPDVLAGNGSNIRYVRKRNDQSGNEKAAQTTHGASQQQGQASAPGVGEIRSVTGVYEGNSHDEGLVVQIFDGKKRHFIYSENGLIPPALKGKTGYTVRIEYKDEKLDEKTAEAVFGEKHVILSKIQNITLVSGKDDPELCDVRLAAETGDPKACNTLGVWYEKGKHSLPKDPKEAVIWYRNAAGGGNTLAMHNLGDCYRDGIGVEKDENEAIQWYNKTIKAGNPIGYEDLGNLYLKQGKRDEARAMYQKAAAAGRASAKKKLVEMK